MNEDDYFYDFEVQEVNDDSYNVLSSNEVHQIMEREVEKVRNVFAIPNVLTRHLLGKTKWDVEVFLERFCDEKMNLDLVATLKANKTPMARTRKQRKIAENKTCDICFITIEGTNVLHFSCDHTFCIECWKSFLDHTLLGSGSMQSIKCPGCDRFIDDDLILPYLTNNKQRDRFTQIITDSFVQFNRLLKWCGAAGCTMAIKVQMVKNTMVKCSCSHEFCFECNGSMHILVQCDLLRKFNELCGNSLDDAIWLAKHSKPCPQCGVNIEKNGGCNYMSCSNCELGFCWLCLNPISHSEHSGHPNCISPDAAKFKAVRTRQLYDCNTKFKAQEESIKLDMKMYKTNQTELKDADDWITINFIHEAVKVLLHARHTLKDSFIFQLLMTDKDSNGNKLSLFELNQGNLRSTTEQLSRALETHLDFENYHEMRKNVQNLTSVCKARTRSLTEIVHEGYENDWWKTVDEE